MLFTRADPPTGRHLPVSSSETESDNVPDPFPACSSANQGSSETPHRPTTASFAASQLMLPEPSLASQLDPLDHAPH